VYGSVSGYGQEGPWVRRPALAAVIHATSGYDLGVCLYQNEIDRPQATGVHVADFLSASLALGGLMIALRARDRTGVGRHVDVSMLDSVLSLMPGEVVSSQFPGDHNLRAYPPSRTRDGFVMIAAVSQPLFESLMRTIGRPELIDDGRFRTNSDRWVNTRALDAIVESWSEQRTGEECERILLEAGVPASRYRTVDEQFDLEQARVRGTFAEVNDAAGHYQIVDSPFHFEGPDQARHQSPAPSTVPSLGADTWDVLSDALGAEVAQRLIDDGVARGARPPAGTACADPVREAAHDVSG
jgi:CoA:oxalate CoA-transferase